MSWDFTEPQRSAIVCVNAHVVFEQGYFYLVIKNHVLHIASPESSDLIWFLFTQALVVAGQGLRQLRLVIRVRV